MSLVLLDLSSLLLFFHSSTGNCDTHCLEKKICVSLRLFIVEKVFFGNKCSLPPKFAIRMNKVRRIIVLVYQILVVVLSIGSTIVFKCLRVGIEIVKFQTTPQIVSSTQLSLLGFHNY